MYIKQRSHNNKSEFIPCCLCFQGLKNEWWERSAADSPVLKNKDKLLWMIHDEANFTRQHHNMQCVMPVYTHHHLIIDVPADQKTLCFGSHFYRKCNDSICPPDEAVYHVEIRLYEQMLHTILWPSCKMYIIYYI